MRKKQWLVLFSIAIFSGFGFSQVAIASPASPPENQQSNGDIDFGDDQDSNQDQAPNAAPDQTSGDSNPSLPDDDGDQN